MITTRLYQKEDQPLWDDFITNSENGLFLFQRDYLEYHSDRFNDHSLLIFDDEHLRAVFPANLRADEVTLSSHDGLTFGGLIYPIKTRIKDLLLITQALVDYASENQIESISFKPVPYYFRKNYCGADLYAFFQSGAQLATRELSTLLRQCGEQTSFSQLRKRAIKKAIKHNVQVQESSDFASFHTLLSEVLSRHDAVPTHSLHELLYLTNLFPDKIQLNCAFLDSTMIAGVVSFDFDNAVHTQYLASSETGRNLGALDLILTTLVERYGEKRILSFGISTEQSGQFLNQGLAQYKESFGGVSSTIDSYNWALNNT